MKKQNFPQIQFDNLHSFRWTKNLWRKLQLPWSFPGVERFCQQGSRSHSKYAIRSANISPHEVLCIRCFLSKPNVLHFTGSHHRVSYTWFQPRIGAAWTCHNGFVCVHTRFRLFQAKVVVWICESFSTRLHHGCIYNNKIKMILTQEWFV